MKKKFKVITWIAGISFVLGLISLDSDSWVPWVMAFVPAPWLALVAYAYSDRR